MPDTQDLQRQIEQLRAEMYAANANRAAIYALLFDELTHEFGRDKAKEVMKRAIYRRGEEIGKKFERFAPGDFNGLCDAFVGGVPDQGAMFAPEVVSCDENGLVVEFFNCPLKNAWRDMGLNEQDCADLCDVAGVIDSGTFEGAGFSFDVTALPQGSTDKCVLRIGRKED